MEQNKIIIFFSSIFTYYFNKNGTETTIVVNKPVVNPCKNVSTCSLLYKFIPNDKIRPVPPISSSVSCEEFGQSLNKRQAVLVPPNAPKDGIFKNQTFVLDSFQY